MWALRHIDPERIDEWLRDLTADPRTGRDPDAVDSSVIDEEMAMFAAFSAQVRG